MEAQLQPEQENIIRKVKAKMEKYLVIQKTENNPYLKTKRTLEDEPPKTEDLIEAMLKGFKVSWQKNNGTINNSLYVTIWVNNGIDNQLKLYDTMTLRSRKKKDSEQTEVTIIRHKQTMGEVENETMKINNTYTYKKTINTPSDLDPTQIITRTLTTNPEREIINDHDNI